MKYRIIPVTPYQQNCSLLYCPETRDAALIDPGGDIDYLLDIIEEEQVKLSQILVTHGHLDHVGGVARLANDLQLPVYGPHEDDKFWLDLIEEQCRHFGFPHSESFIPTRWLHQGDQIQIGKDSLQVLHCPGHTPGHINFFSESLQTVWVGDVLFKGSVGRTDFPLGDHQQLLRSIRERLWPLGESVTFVPGHGPCSTLGHEMRTNPYVGHP